MTIDPRTPVIVGVGQTVHRPAHVGESASPAALMAESLTRAADDSGGGRRLLERAASIRTVDQMSWPYANPGREVAGLLGLSPAETVLTTVGGNSPQLLVNETATEILGGRRDIVLICGAEAIHSRRLSRATSEHLDWPRQDPGVAAPDRVIGIDRPGTSEAEQARSLALPTQVYPVLECALRAAAGEDVETHQRRISELWARFSAVAAGNPYAWSPERRTAEEIRTVTPNNRMVGFPYPKLMNANLQVDQGAALILCSAEAATSAGVPRDRWVFPWAAADAHDHWFVSDRWSLADSPAIAACGQSVFELAGIGVDDLAWIDLYSCFPSAVQLGAAALGLTLDDPARALTVTGGLTFAGGPGNNYATHSIATMVQRLRSDEGTYGLITALGWYATKHSLGVYSTNPPPNGFRHRHAQEAVDAQPSRGVDAAYTGPVRVEAFTVMHERDGSPSLGIVACLTPGGRRAWANTRQPDLLKGLLTDDPVGRGAFLAADGDLRVD